VRSWAVDLTGTGIRVNVLSPGPTATPGLMNGLASTGMLGTLVAGMIDQTAVGPLGDPSETAAVALFLASDDSSFMTGSEVLSTAAAPRSDPQQSPRASASHSQLAADGLVVGAIRVHRHKHNANYPLQKDRGAGHSGRVFSNQWFELTRTVI